MTDSGNRKRHRIYMRILLLVDVLAPIRAGMRTSEICHAINKRSGESYCERTIQRDLSVMQEIGFVRKVSRQMDGRKFKTQVWTLDLTESSLVQAVAFKKLES